VHVLVTRGFISGFIVRLIRQHRVADRKGVVGQVGYAKNAIVNETGIVDRLRFLNIVMNYGRVVSWFRHCDVNIFGTYDLRGLYVWQIAACINRSDVRSIGRRQYVVNNSTQKNELIE